MSFFNDKHRHDTEFTARLVKPLQMVWALFRRWISRAPKLVREIPGRWSRRTEAMSLCPVFTVPHSGPLHGSLFLGTLHRCRVWLSGFALIGCNVFRERNSLRIPWTRLLLRLRWVGLARLCHVLREFSVKVQRGQLRGIRFVLLFVSNYRCELEKKASTGSGLLLCTGEKKKKKMTELQKEVMQ